MKLAELEARFYALVTAPESVAKTLAALGPEARREVEAFVAGDGRLSAVERLDVYAGMYFFRIRDVLRDEYPRTLALLGETAFHNLVTDYLAGCPPAHPSLREAGARLPLFLGAHAAARELGEPGALEQIPAPQFPALRLVRVPASVLLANHFALLPQWRGSEDAPETPEARPETLLVWRRDLDVFHRAIDAEEAECLERVGGGIAFAELCARLAIGRTDEVAAVRAFELVARWAADGLLCEPAADGRLCEPD